MSEMVERVAEALLNKGDPESTPARPWAATPEREREYWRNHARAAIEAMREPTDAMIRAAGIGGIHQKVRWQAMIDEALA